MKRSRVSRGVVLLIGLSMLVGCSGSSPGSAPGASGTPASGKAPQKRTAVVAISSPIPAFSFGFLGTSGGGAQAFNELWEQGLVTSGVTNTAPVPRIAAELPSVDAGTAVVLPDGRFRTTWKIRPDVKWADGTDLTAQDYAFGMEVTKDRENPLAGAVLVVNIGPMVDSLDVLDDKTFDIMWREPFYMFDSLGFFALQPLPSHVLRSIWDERNMERFANHPYWREGYFQTGPYVPARFEPQVEIVLQAVPNYFLGAPKLDTITIKQYGDSNGAYAALLAGAVDMTGDNVITAEQAMELKEKWDRSGEGKVYVGYGTTRGIFPMFDPENQAEPAMLDARVRQALYFAIDRETWANVALVGRKENTANEILPPDHPLYAFVKDGLKSYGYDPQQAIRMFQEAGWDRGPDGTLRNRTDGRAFREEILTLQGGESDVSILADMWGKIGVDAPQRILPNAQQGDRIIRQSFPGVEISARGYGDLLLTRAECETVPRAPRFDGANRGHYCTPEGDRLIAQYRGSITREAQGQAIGDIEAFYGREFPMMPLFYNITNPAVVKGLSALTPDFSGGLQPPGYYGSYVRNAHLWEWTE